MLLKGLNLCSGHMNNWQYLSLGDLEQNELFQPRPQGAFPWPWEKRPGDEVGTFPQK